jgi:hypothetical protein
MAHVHNHGKEYGYMDQGLRQFVARTPNIDFGCVAPTFHKEPFGYGMRRKVV